MNRSSRKIIDPLTIHLDFDLSRWKALPIGQNIVQYGRFEIKHSSELKSALDIPYIPGDDYTDVYYIRWKDSNTGEYTEWKFFSKSLRKNPLTQALSDELEEEILAERKRQQKLRRKQREKERQQELKQEAEARGVSVEQIKQEHKQQKNERTQQRRKEKDVDQLERIIKVAPKIKELKDEIDSIYEKLNKENPPVNITRPNNGIKYIEQSTRLLREWQRLPKKK